MGAIKQFRQDERGAISSFFAMAASIATILVIATGVFVAEVMHVQWLERKVRINNMVLAGRAVINVFALNYTDESFGHPAAVEVFVKRYVEAELKALMEPSMQAELRSLDIGLTPTRSLRVSVTTHMRYHSFLARFFPNLNSDFPATDSQEMQVNCLPKGMRAASSTTSRTAFRANDNNPFDRLLNSRLQAASPAVDVHEFVPPIEPESTSGNVVVTFQRIESPDGSDTERNMQENCKQIALPSIDPATLAHGEKRYFGGGNNEVPTFESVSTKLR